VTKSPVLRSAVRLCWWMLTRITIGQDGSADMAIRLDKAFGGGAETWLRLQMAYDLAQARQHEGEIKVKPLVRRKLHEPRV
jgi:plasmid maintenance system antidote protein VapI